MNLRTLFLNIILLLFFIPSNMLFAQIPNYVPSSGLVGWWPFNGNANDVSGFGNNGTINGPTLTTDRFGIADKAYDFNPSLYQFININQNQALNNLNQISISTWLFPNSNASYNHMVNKSNDANLHQFILSSNNNGIYFYFGNGSSYFQTNTSPILNQWNHIVVTYTYGSGSDNCLIYLNGILSGSFVTTVPLQTTNYNLKFGSFGNSNINTVKGKLDDIGIWDRALTECEIQQLYLSQLNPLNVNAGPDMYVCSGDQITINATGASTYTWSGGIQNGIPFVPTASSQYFVTGTNLSGCSGTDTVNVNVLPAPVIAITNDTICLGQSTTLTASISSNCGNLSGSLTNGLVGYWPFCGNVNDESGNLHHGTNFGGTFSNDRFGNPSRCLSLNGSSRVDVGNLNLGNPTTSYTYSNWFKTGVQGFPNRTMITDYNSSSGDDNIFACWHLLEDANKARTELRVFPNGYGTISNSSVNNNQWHQILTTIDRSTNLMSIYIDGVLNSSTPIPQTINFNDNGFLRFGIHKWNNIFQSALYWVGELDDIGIWNRVLTPSEIQQLYTQGQTTYSWTPGGATTPSITVSPTVTTNYTYNAIYSNGFSCSSSQLVEVLQPTSSNLVVNQCGSYTLNGQVYSQSGVYSQVLPNVDGCDSTITLNLALNSPPSTPNIYVQNQTTLSTDSIPGLSYQWFFCTDLIDVPGATNPTFNPTANAYYAVIVSNACGSDTSDCADVSSVGLENLETQNIFLYPNPTNSVIKVIVPTQLLGQEWKLLDIQGRLVLNGKVEEESQIIDLGDLARGSYWMRISPLQPLQVIKN